MKSAKTASASASGVKTTKLASKSAKTADAARTSQKKSAEVKTASSKLKKQKSYKPHTISNGLYTLENGFESYYLNAQTSDGQTNVTIEKQSAGNAQKWQVKSTDDGYYTLQNAQTGKYLDASYSHGGWASEVSVSGGGNLDSQKWSAKLDSTNSVVFIGKTSGLALDLWSVSAYEGESLQLFELDGSVGQKWALRSAYYHIEDGFHIMRNGASTTRCLEVRKSSKSNKANVQISNHNEKNSQVWYTRSAGNGRYTIQNANSGKYLAVSTSAAGNGANVWQYARNNSNAQKWYASFDAAGRTVFRSAISGRALEVAGGKDANGANVRIADLNGSSGQGWTLYSGYYTIKSGTYSLASAVGGKKCLAVKGGSKSNNANVVIWAQGKKNNQKWQITDKGEGLYTLQNLASGKFLQAKAGKTTNGTSVVQYRGLNSDAQKWYAAIDTQGRLVFRDALSGRALDVKGAKKANGTNVRIMNPSNSKGQGWTLAATTRWVDTSNKVDVERNTILSYTNKYRKQVGRKSLYLDESMNEAAQLRAKEMARTGIFSHTRPNGTSCFTVFTQLKVLTGAAGENIYWATWRSAKSASIGWRNSQGHYENMITAGYTRLGVGVAKGKNGWYYVQLFSS